MHTFTYLEAIHRCVWVVEEQYKKGNTELNIAEGKAQNPIQKL